MPRLKNSTHRYMNETQRQTMAEFRQKQPCRRPRLPATYKAIPTPTLTRRSRDQLRQRRQPRRGSLSRPPG
jgi:hypothetical protein